MKSKICMLFFLVVLMSCRNVVDSESMDSYCLKATRDFFTQVATSRYATALDNLLLSNKDIHFEDSATTVLREGFATINQMSGKYLGYKLLKKRIVVGDVGVYSFLVKYEKKFYRFIFTFYNTGTKIKIYKFSYDDVLDLELEESLKLYTK